MTMKCPSCQKYLPAIGKTDEPMVNVRVLDLLRILSAAAHAPNVNSESWDRCLAALVQAHRHQATKEIVTS